MVSGGLIFVVLFVVIFVGSALLSRAYSTGMSALFKNTLFRGMNKTADSLIKNPLIFKTQANFDALKKRIYNDIVPPDQGAAWPARLYLAQAGKNTQGEYVAKFRKGTKSSTSLEVQVTLRHDSAGVVGSVDVIRWQRVDGAPMFVNDMKLLRRRVEEIVLSLDPHAQLSHRSAPAAPATAAPAGYAAFNAPPSAPVPQPSPRPASPVPPSRPAASAPTPAAPQQGSRYAVPDTSSWVDRSRPSSR